MRAVAPQSAVLRELLTRAGCSRLKRSTHRRVYSSVSLQSKTYHPLTVWSHFFQFLTMEPNKMSTGKSRNAKSRANSLIYFFRNIHGPWGLDFIRPSPTFGPF